MGLPHRKTAIDLAYRLQRALRCRPNGVYLLTGCPRSGTSAMREWLQRQPRVAAMFEPRILMAAHRFMDEVERFEDLHLNRALLIEELRRLVLAYCAGTKFLWKKRLVIKEPLESIALPDHRFSAFLAHCRTLFPGMKIIFMLRDPVPTIWSMRNRLWGYSLSKSSLRSYSLMECIQIWRQCAQLAVDHAADPDFHICRFERLIAEPVRESRRLFDFLAISGRADFQPKPTQSVGFSDEELALILKETQRERALLEPVLSGGGSQALPGNRRPE